MEVIAGFVFGFVGSPHCIGMCGPIVLALPLGTRGFPAFFFGRFFYNLGRVVTYTLMGAAMGLVGAGLLLPLLQQNISIAAGALILIFAFLKHVARVSVPVPSLFGSLLQKIQTALSSLLRQQSGPALFALGLVNGLLPCGFVYVAIASAAVTADVIRGMMFMAGFGLGTVPALVGFSFFPKLASASLRAKIARILPAFTILVGVLLIIRGLDLGIPFISPKLSGSATTVTSHGHH